MNRFLVALAALVLCIIALSTVADASQVQARCAKERSAFNRSISQFTARRALCKDSANVHKCFRKLHTHFSTASAEYKACLTYGSSSRRRSSSRGRSFHASVKKFQRKTKSVFKKSTAKFDFANGKHINSHLAAIIAKRTAGQAKYRLAVRKYHRHMAAVRRQIMAKSKRSSVRCKRARRALKAIVLRGASACRKTLSTAAMKACLARRHIQRHYAHRRAVRACGHSRVHPCLHFKTTFLEAVVAATAKCRHLKKGLQDCYKKLRLERSDLREEFSSQCRTALMAVQRKKISARAARLAKWRARKKAMLVKLHAKHAKFIAQSKADQRAYHIQRKAFLAKRKAERIALAKKLKAQRIARAKELKAQRTFRAKTFLWRCKFNTNTKSRRHWCRKFTAFTGTHVPIPGYKAPAYTKLVKKCQAMRGLAGRKCWSQYRLARWAWRIKRTQKAKWNRCHRAHGRARRLRCFKFYHRYVRWFSVRLETMKIREACITKHTDSDAQQICMKKSLSAWKVRRKAFRLKVTKHRCASALTAASKARWCAKYHRLVTGVSSYHSWSKRLSAYRAKCKGAKDAFTRKFWCGKYTAAVKGLASHKKHVSRARTCRFVRARFVKNVRVFRWRCRRHHSRSACRRLVRSYTNRARANYKLQCNIAVAKSRFITASKRKLLIQRKSLVAQRAKCVTAAAMARQSCRGQTGRMYKLCYSRASGVKCKAYQTLRRSFILAVYKHRCHKGSNYWCSRYRGYKLYMQRRQSPAYRRSLSAIRSHTKVHLVHRRACRAAAKRGWRKCRRFRFNFVKRRTCARAYKKKVCSRISGSRSSLRLRLYAHRCKYSTTARTRKYWCRRYQRGLASKRKQSACGAAKQAMREAIQARAHERVICRAHGKSCIRWIEARFTAASANVARAC